MGDAYHIDIPVDGVFYTKTKFGIDKIFMRSGSNVLYLARLDDSSIFTISYISDIGYKDGMVFVVGKSDVIQEVDNFRLLDIRSNVQFNAVDNTKYDDSAAAYKNSIDNLGKRIDVLFCDVGHLDHVCLLSCYPCFVLCIKVGRWGMSEKEVEFNVDFLAKWLETMADMEELMDGHIHEHDMVGQNIVEHGMKEQDMCHMVKEGKNEDIYKFTTVVQKAFGNIKWNLAEISWNDKKPFTTKELDDINLGTSVLYLARDASVVVVTISHLPDIVGTISTFPSYL
ncbi:ulp1 protease family, C-terminal catalytic domain-containing protein [Tanacetum coccineum]